MDLVSYVARFLAGGALVCVFAIISDAWTPKRFAGLFSAAPSVLLAGLAVTLLAQGASKGKLTADGAIAGAIGLIVYCLVATPAIRRFKSLFGFTLAVLVWFGVSFCAYAALATLVGQ